MDSGSSAGCAMANRRDREFTGSIEAGKFGLVPIFDDRLWWGSVFRNNAFRRPEILRGDVHSFAIKGWLFNPRDRRFGFISDTLMCFSANWNGEQYLNRTRYHLRSRCAEPRLTADRASKRLTVIEQAGGWKILLNLSRNEGWRFWLSPVDPVYTRNYSPALSVDSWDKALIRAILHFSFNQALLPSHTYFNAPTPSFR